MISNGGRFAISEFGLLITDIIESDAGNYTCVASNDVGSAQLTSSLLSVYGMYCSTFSSVHAKSSYTHKHHYLYFIKTRVIQRILVYSLVWDYECFCSKPCTFCC